MLIRTTPINPLSSGEFAIQKFILVTSRELLQKVTNILTHGTVIEKE